MSWSSFCLLRNCATDTRNIIEQAVPRYTATILSYYFQFFISISVVSISHSCVRKRGSDVGAVHEHKDVSNIIPSTKSSSSVEQHEHPHEIKVKSSVNSKSSAKAPTPEERKSGSSTVTAPSGDFPPPPPPPIAKPVQPPVDKKKKSHPKMFVFEPAASFLNSEGKKGTSQEDETIRDAPSLMLVRKSLLSDEISFEKPVDIHQQQKEVPTKPKQSLREQSLTLQPTMSSERAEEQQTTAVMAIVRTDKTMQSIER
uniref:Uncharacterized protein n=1 Tax=Haemonchus contortus TaxID=6289 RepID=A0A7I5EBX9_HAECO